MGEGRPVPLSLLEAGLAALIDSVLRFRCVHISTINHYIASSNTLFEIAGFAVESIDSVLNGDAAHIAGFLSNDEVYNVAFQIGDSLLRCIKICDFDGSLLVSILDGLCSTFGTKQIGAKNPGKRFVAL